jgi:hypothetical protein
MTTDHLKQTVRAILLNDWDPIGIAGVPKPSTNMIATSGT